MQKTFKLTNGHTVQTTDLGPGAGVEFVTSNGEGDVISTVVMTGHDAFATLRDLAVAERLAAL